jgi:quercetin dioxygenase-like cupin family protein
MRPSRSVAVAASASDAGGASRAVAIEIRRFGVGHRRAVGPDGSVGLSGGSIHADGRGSIAELVLGRNARVEPHANPNTTYLVVIEGGGWVGVGDEWTRIAAGEVAVWPADIPHTAWTEHSEMRAIVVEFTGSDEAVPVAEPAHLTDATEDAVGRGVGQLAERNGPAAGREQRDGEPV